MYKIAGYAVDLELISQIVNRLGIPNKNDLPTHKLEWPINDYLAKRGITNFKAGTIFTPGREARPDPELPDMFEMEDSMMFITRNEWVPKKAWTEEVSIEESDSDREVKKWLIEEGGFMESQLRWLAIWDDANLMRSGPIPLENDHIQIRWFKHEDQPRVLSEARIMEIKATTENM